MAEPFNSDLKLEHAVKFERMRRGMVPERIVLLEDGDLIYRFSEKRLSQPQRLASSWWWTDDAFERIQSFLALDPGNAGEIARMQGGVMYRWSKIDMLVTAVVTAPIKAFQGPGKYQVEQEPGRAPILFLPPADLDQTYIPDIVDPTTKILDETGRSAIALLAEEKIPSFDDLGIRTLKAARGRAVYMQGNPRLH